jgi:uncharacterized protein
MDTILKKFLEPFRENVDIKEIILFGSRARGDERPESDYDILLIVSRKDRALIDLLYDNVMACLLDSGRLISLKIFSEHEWNSLTNLKTPFSQAVLKEGVALG